MSKKTTHIFFDFNLSDLNFQRLCKHAAKYESYIIVSERTCEDKHVHNVNLSVSMPKLTEEQKNLAKDFDKEMALLENCPDLRSVYFRAMKVKLFEHNIFAVHKWLFFLKYMISHHKDRKIICVFPYGISSQSIYLLEAEGEVSAFRKARLLYKKTDFLPNFLRQYCIANKITTKKFHYFSFVSIFSLGRNFRKFLRIYCHFLVRAFLILLRYSYLNLSKTAKNRCYCYRNFKVNSPF